MPTRILVVDDHMAILAGLRDVLGDEHSVTIESSGAEALYRATTEEFDVLVLDYYIGPVTCVRIAETAKIRFPNTKVCILTHYLNEEVMGSLAHVQPEGVLDKSMTVAEIVASVKRVMEGERVYAPAAVMALMGLIAGTSAKQKAKDSDLTDVERKVLALTAEGSSASEIAETMSLSAAYVNLIRRDLKRRFNVRSIAELVTLYHSSEHLL